MKHPEVEDTYEDTTRELFKLKSDATGQEALEEIRSLYDQIKDPCDVIVQVYNKFIEVLADNPLEAFYEIEDEEFPDQVHIHRTLELIYDEKTGFFIKFKEFNVLGEGEDEDFSHAIEKEIIKKRHTKRFIVVTPKHQLFTIHYPNMC